METKIINQLGSKELKIVKRIIIISDSQNGERELGELIYTRPLTAEYNLKKQEEEDRSTTSLQRLLQEYPSQKNYPNDRIDEIIFDSIKRSFPKSKQRNDKVFFNTDEESLSRLKNKNIAKSAIRFSVDLSSIDDPSGHVGRSFNELRVSINIYTSHKSNILDGRFFDAKYNENEEYTLEKLNTVTFE